MAEHRASNPFAGPLSSPPALRESCYDAPASPRLAPTPEPIFDHQLAEAGRLPAGAAASRGNVGGRDDAAVQQPLLSDEVPPRAPYMRNDSARSTSSLDSHRDSMTGSPYDEKYASGVALDELSKNGKSPFPPLRPLPQKRNRKWIALGTIAVLALILAIAIPVGIVVKNSTSKKNASGTKAADGAASVAPTQSATDTAAAPAPSATGPTVVNGITFQGAATGGDGSTVTATNGTTFVYHNKFGGTWSAQPFDNSARAQDDVPPLSEPWDFSKNFVRGVNLGGWLNTEPFICNAMYDRFENTATQAIDEWTLSLALDGVGPDEKKKVFEAHYSTFITEEDFAQIAGAGLNWVRIPLPFWAIETYPGEPYYTGQWPYFLKAIEWARKYGIRINLDLHAMPGSQNGWDHSGRRSGNPHFLLNAMGLANAQRGLNYVRILAQFISQPQYAPVVPVFGIINEPQMTAIGQTVVESFYSECYRIIRSITPYGQGPIISIFDGFAGPSSWLNYLPNADRLAYDAHTYFIFSGGASNDSFANNNAKACAVSDMFRTAQGGGPFGLAASGEYSLAINDCGQYLNGVGQGSRYEGNFVGGPTAPVGSCDEWILYQNWSPARKQGFQQLLLSWMDSTQSSFFWTWKVTSNSTGQITVPMWSYSLGLAEGWIPADIRKYAGTCSNVQPWAGTLNVQQAGAPGGKALADAAILPAWPPAITSVNSAFTYTQTQPIFSLPVSTPTVFPTGATVTSVDAGSGWANTADNTPFYTPVAGMQYSGAWGVAGETILKRSPTSTATAVPTAHPRRARAFR